MGNNFSLGGGCFPCACCGRNTRHTGVQSVDSTLCPDCYELAGIYNVLQDEGEESVKQYASDVRWHVEQIIAKGGEPDAEAYELLDIVNA